MATSIHTAQHAQPITLYTNRYSGLDTAKQYPHTALACFNQPPRFAVLQTNGRHAATQAAFVSSASSTPIACLSNGRQGQGGYMPAGFVGRYCEPCPLSAAHAFAELSGH